MAVQQLLLATGTAKSAVFRSIRFSDKIEVTCGNTTTTLLYEQIAFIEENNDCFCLWVNGKVFLVIYKNAFETGDAESFRAFILAKCAESHPLLTKSQFNSPHFRRILPFVILFTALILLLPCWILANLQAQDMADLAQETAIPEKYNTAPEQGVPIQKIISYWWEDRIDTVETVTHQGWAVVFGAEDFEGIYYIHAMVLKETDNGYRYVKSGNYAVAEIIDCNQQSDILFESPPSLFGLSDEPGNESPTLTYGVAYADFWDKDVSDTQKQKYTVRPFQYGDTKMVLYYRLVGK